MGRGIGFLGNYLKWILLTIITFSIYALWIPLKFENWKVANTRLVNPATEKYVEKYSDEWYEERYASQFCKTKFRKNNRVFAVFIIVLSALSVGYDVYLIINISLNVLNLTYDSYGMFISVLVSYIGVLYLILSGITLFFLGCFGIRNTSVRAPFFKGMMIFGYVVITLQSLPIVLATPLLVILFKGIASDEIMILLYAAYSLLNTIIFAIDITLIVLFAKNLSNTVSNNNTSNINSHIELSKYGMLAICFAVLSLCASIAISVVLGGMTILVLTCFVNTVISLYIYYRTAYALPIYYQMSNSNVATISEQPTQLPKATTLIVESNNDRINRALGTSYRNLLTGEIDDEKSNIGLKAIEEAIGLGSITVYSQLGAYYEDQNEYEKAFESYLKGYELGSRHAPYFIARMYEEGRGRPKDMEKACEWHQKAAALGNETSKCIVSSDFGDKE